MNTDISKRDLGRFVTERRRALGLTQKELATRLHVTESAVSKWERGLSYPDITMVQALAGELGVTGQELISASEDREGRADRRDARVYRGWRTAVLWSTLTTYAAAILTCFIVNISVDHALTWFWVVLPAVALAFSLTTLPLLRVPRPGWLALGASVVSLFLLLVVVQLMYAPGQWLWIALSAILLGLLLVFVPILLARAQLPAPLGRHLTVTTMLIDTVALLLFLGVVALAIGRPELWTTLMLPLAAIGLVVAWIVALIIRYVLGPGFAPAALVAAVLGASIYGVSWAVDRVLGTQPSGHLDLLTWKNSTITANVQFLVASGALLLAIGFGIAAVAQGLARRGRGSREPGERAREAATER